MTDRELLKQALDALDAYSWEQVQVSANALRDRLAQPEQKLMIDCPRCGHCCPQPNQEPVKDRLDFWALFDENQRLRAELKFNTTPPQQWVGLTDEEIQTIVNKVASEYQTSDTFAKAIEAKLKEKNGG
jgi:hypothetical protein